ncbi:DUF4214 domain-containing protein [Methylobacterium oxalidis]|uniref:DUF4214 domain-containing protein n=1 Tax=Methylobacterium oxalidis TaxID=944322 RepID=A0A512J9H7_9HYPH|nr:DUF4214 domain-containing protein [Methylobacterium oxalidis]GEP06519.1 hypothetical protein MOX02_45570 [Methylobacterium oxalidis]GJE30717.1 hypothetical protein LDDCCGHA_0886 [Methylobacterium oxalidis]GLS63903.1 hypothetical protein GCM10007888_22840 [Methylobacterium oxalidis]
MVNINVAVVTDGNEGDAVINVLNSGSVQANDTNGGFSGSFFSAFKTSQSYYNVDIKASNGNTVDIGSIYGVNAGTTTDFLIFQGLNAGGNVAASMQATYNPTDVTQNYTSTITALNFAGITTLRVFAINNYGQPFYFDSPDFGNISAGGADSTPPTLAISSVTGATNVIDGHTIVGAIGAEDAGATVTIRDGSTVLGTAVSDAQGNFSFALPNLTTGSGQTYNLTASATDVAGNEGVSTNFSFSLDMVPNQNLFGSFGPHLDDTAKAIYELYDAVLDRAPDALGFESYIRSAENGASLRDIAASMLGSAEAQSHVGATGNAEFVERLYETALHRGSDSEGLTTYTQYLDNGGSRADVALMFAQSAENVAGLTALSSNATLAPDPTASDVARLYYGVLDRAPEAGGLQGWTNSVEHGTSLQDVVRAFLSSDEYEVITTGLTDTQFVESLYQQVLGRTAEDAGVQFWSSVLAQGGSRSTIANAFADSLEFQSAHAGANNATYVQDLYQAVLGRAGDEAGIQAWSAALDGQSLTRSDLAHVFTASTEFQTKFVQPSDAAFVDSLYMGALGRHADDAGFESWTTALTHGISRAEVAVAISESVEAQTHLVNVIEQGWHLV